MIRLVRLDYRLVHGQILAAWVNHLSAQRIILVDDTAANDQMKSAALKLAKPTGIRLNIFTVAKTIEKMPKILSLNENIMMVFGTTSALVDVCKKTSAFNEIQYGATFNKKGSMQIDESVFLDEQEQNDTRELLSLGVTIYSQQTPARKKVPITKI
ncbi:PTS sugar transporter subunit IIB [Thermophilibacter immobilis]|uniref:PTS sugar transporter subunit IIB n=1 Tax=Thermophilibacter immobilis TaxID=2779519 RepID=A0A7S7M880_9ACTN|nr:PTS sugar transporter subunit IIB [Thermophilibacter immobilis]QOY60564.1 PTS sugar transporter subunit IIB [Thermophilibacter immobilis]